MPTLIWEDKFTTGGTWSSSGGTPVILDTPVPPSGGKALQCDAIADYVLYDTWTDNNYVRIVAGVWVYIDVLPSTDTRMFKVDSSPSEGWFVIHPASPNWELAIRSDGTPSISTVFAGAASARPQDTWYWCQFLYDVSADPWEIRGNADGVIISATGAAAASNLNNANVVLGNTAGGSAYTVLFGHLKIGVAADDNDWWPVPTDYAIEAGSAVPFWG